MGYKWHIDFPVSKKLLVTPNILPNQRQYIFWVWIKKRSKMTMNFKKKPR